MLFRKVVLCNRLDDVLYRLDAQLSKASSVLTARTFRPDLPLCQELSNCSSLHPSGRLSNTSKRRPVFDQLWDFFPKHKYGKTAATVQTMCIPVRTRLFVRQVVHSKFNRPDDIIHGPVLKLHIWKLRASNQPSGRQMLWSERAKP
jgi:hypothetical protein